MFTKKKIITIILMLLVLTECILWPSYMLICGLPWEGWRGFASERFVIYIKGASDYSTVTSINLYYIACSLILILTIAGIICLLKDKNKAVVWIEAAELIFLIVIVLINMLIRVYIVSEEHFDLVDFFKNTAGFWLASLIAPALLWITIAISKSKV